MAQFTVYKSTDASAPVLTGETDKLCALLTACLVDGYGAKAAAGWTREFDGASKSVYRPGAGSRFYYRVNDAGPGAGTFKEARINGYETMTDVDTGLNLFPTVVQQATGMFIRKSATADATARAWKIFADSRTCYVYIAAGDTANCHLGHMMGDFYSLVAGDLYNAAIIARVNENSNTASHDKLDVNSSSITTVVPGHYSARGYLGVAGAHNFGRQGNYNVMNSNTYGSIPYPNPADASIRLVRNHICDVSVPQHCYRGWLRGAWYFAHPIALLTDGELFTGTGELAGKTFEVVKFLARGDGVMLMETSNTLDN